MNRRQLRLLSTMRSIKYASLVQDRQTSAAWYVEGQWPIAVRVKLTCRDVHGLVMAGVITGMDPQTPWMGRKLIYSASTSSL